MEKLDLQTFRYLKQEVLEYIKRFEKAKEKGENLIDEENEKFQIRYREILKILSEHDLSDIDFEEWRGMFFYVDDSITLDFSRKRANLDFSIIEYTSLWAFPNFKSCKIKNFDFDKNDYSPEMFDEEFRKENEDRFLSDNIPDEVADRFFEGELTLTDIKKYPELSNKVGEKNIIQSLRYLFELLGREEFCKLDAEFIDKTNNTWKNFLEANPNLRTAEQIMPELYKIAREKTLDSENGLFTYFFPQDVLGETFKELNPDLFLSEDVPEEIKKGYYHKALSLKDFSDNLQYFERKKVAQAFYSGAEKSIVSLYGEDIYKLFKNYKPIMDIIINDWLAMASIEVPSGEITEEQRKEIMGSVIINHISRNGYQKVQGWDSIKMILDFISIESLPELSDNTRSLLYKYDIDRIIESRIDVNCLFNNRQLTDLNEISSIEGIDWNYIKRFVTIDGRKILTSYTVQQLLDYGIKDLSTLSKVTNDLHQIKEMLKTMPMDLINLGGYGISKSGFIERYGIENIIALDEETGGMFSYPMWSNDIYLTLFAQAEAVAPKIDENKKLTYEEFKNRMYEILLHARDEKGPLRTRDFPDYDFIHGDFRKEHPEIFIDGDIPKQVKEDFYTGRITAELVRQNLELIQLLQEKDLRRAFYKKDMIAGISLSMKDKDGNIRGGIPNKVNMAEYLSEKLGQEEFLKLCAEYGKCLDEISLVTNGEITAENIRETVEELIYKRIKTKGMKYYEFLPASFQEKHPELFLPKEIDEELRTKFYNGEFTFEDIRKNPQIKEVLLTKDISVGFGKIKYGLLAYSRQRYVNGMWEILSEQDIMYFAEKYGKFLNDIYGKFFNDIYGNINQGIFEKGQSLEERESLVQKNIEENILNRTLPYDETVPEFFKQRHPEMFLDEEAPLELKKAFYDNESSRKAFQSILADVRDIDFIMIKDHPEWRGFLQGKDLSRAFSQKYSELFKRFDSSTLLKLGIRNPETIEKMVQNHKEDLLENWYKSTGGKFVPHHVVMLNFPDGEIDSFLSNSKRWSQLMRIENYNLNDDGKTAILKAAYAMGVFKSSDEGFNKTMKLFTDVPQELTQEEYSKVDKMLERFIPYSNVWGNISYDEKTIELFRSSYTLNENGKYVLSIDKQKNKDSIRTIRGMLETAQVPRILTPEKAHQIFDSFAMQYNPEFAKFFSDNLEEILLNPEYIKYIATIQRQFKDIVRTNAGRRLTLSVAQDYVKSVAYTDIEIGNEAVAEQAKIAGYSQKDFEAIQRLFNEGEVREFSSIPRIQGTSKGYTYEMLKLDDPLALTIGTLTDCCQEIHGAGQTSMEHSVVSPDGRVFCVRDEKGRLVAQSWFWRNQYTGCFDNIEIPDRIFALYEKEHPDKGRKGLTTKVLEVYKQATQDLMQEDEKVYQELLDNGTITKEQYEALLLGKVTIGFGYNDIADAIKADKTLHVEKNQVRVKGTERLPAPYTDASTQYTIAERNEIVESEYENLYVYQDEVPIYDGTNMYESLLLTLKRMKQETGGYNLAYINVDNDEEKLSKSQGIINSIAREYDFNPDTTNIMATRRMAIIYSKDDEKIRIGDLLSSPLKEGLSEEQKQKAKSHIMYQIKKALKQIGVQNSEVDMSLLSDKQQMIIQSAIQEIEKENDKRGDR